MKNTTTYEKKAEIAVGYIYDPRRSQYVIEAMVKRSYGGEWELLPSVYLGSADLDRYCLPLRRDESDHVDSRREAIDLINDIVERMQKLNWDVSDIGNWANFGM